MARCPVSSIVYAVPAAASCIVVHHGPVPPGLEFMGRSVWSIRKADVVKLAGCGCHALIEPGAGRAGGESDARSPDTAGVRRAGPTVGKTADAPREATAGVMRPTRKAVLEPSVVNDVAGRRGPSHHQSQNDYRNAKERCLYDSRHTSLPEL